MYGPSAPGQKIAENLPYFFDEVFALQNWKDDEGNFKSAFQTRRDAQYEAKDRSGALALAEPANLDDIRSKILKTIPATTVAGVLNQQEEKTNG